MGPQGLFGGRRQQQAGAARFAALVGKKMPGQGHHIVRPLPQGGNQQGKDIEPVIQILAEDALGHCLGHVPVGGGHHPDVQAHRLFAADPLHFPLLQHPQQLGLQRQGHFRHFVQQQGAALGLLELASLGLIGTGEGAFFITEEGRFQQAFGNGCAVDGDKGTFAPGGMVVDVAGHHLLAHPGLPGEQDGGVGLGHPGGQGKQVAGSGIHRHHVGILTHGRQAVTGHMLEQGLGLERLEKEVAGPRPHGLNRTVHIGKGRHQHHRQVRILATDFLQQGDAVHGLHAHVADDNGHRPFGQDLQRFRAGGCREDSLTGQFQGIHHCFPQVGIVLDDQDGQVVRHLLSSFPRQIGLPAPPAIPG